MAEIFKLGGVEVSVPEVIQILTKPDDEKDDQIICSNSYAGFIFKWPYYFQKRETRA
jgi:hypothetical protein